MQQDFGNHTPQNCLLPLTRQLWDSGTHACFLSFTPSLFLFLFWCICSFGTTGIAHHNRPAGQHTAEQTPWGFALTMQRAPGINGRDSCTTTDCGYSVLQFKPSRALNIPASHSTKQMPQLVSGRTMQNPGFLRTRLPHSVFCMLSCD